MKKDELKELLLLSLTEEISDGERILLESEALPDYRFGTSFRDRVLLAIGTGSARSLLNLGYQGYFYKAFSRIALTGLAAIVVLIVSLLISQGSLSYDTLLGFDSNVDEGLISLLID